MISMPNQNDGIDSPDGSTRTRSRPRCRDRAPRGPERYREQHRDDVAMIATWSDTERIAISSVTGRRPHRLAEVEAASPTIQSANW